MKELGIAVMSVAVGVALGAAVVSLRRFLPGSPQEPVPPRLEARFDVQAAELRRLADAATARDGEAEWLRTELSGARRALEEISVRERERRELQAGDSEAIRRLSTVLAGSSSKGRAGENVLRELLSELPPGMLVTDFKVNGKVVEFGLLLPDGRRLPIDSKWAGALQLEALHAAEDDSEREARTREVERVVALRAKEVAQYLDPALTAPVAVAAVPDAAYSVLRRAHSEAFARGVVIVPYSTALPVLLFLYSLVHRYGDAGDVLASLSEVAGLLDAMESVVENKITRAATMIANGADEFRSQLGKARGSVARGRATGADSSPSVGLPGDVLQIVN